MSVSLNIYILYMHVNIVIHFKYINKLKFSNCMPFSLNWKCQKVLKYFWGQLYVTNNYSIQYFTTEMNRN